MKLYIRACLVLIVTGALGNMIDRIFYGPLEYADATGLFSGAVVDWIDFYWFWSFNFNIADSCIVVSAFMLIIYIIVNEVKDVIARRKAEELNDNPSVEANKEESNEGNDKDSSNDNKSE